jgi:hypothetical protein
VRRPRITKDTVRRPRITKDTVRRPRITKGGAIFAAVVTVGWIGLAGPASALFAAAPPASGSVPTLGGWNTTADGNVVDILIDNTTGLAGVHPFSEADFPEAESDFATGPFGTSLATVFWPGSAGGNFGSLSGELGFPSQLSPITSQTNDPVKAASAYPAGPASDRYPAGSSGGVATMESTASSTGTSASADLTGDSASTVLSFSGAKGSSSSQASSTASADATTDLSDVKLLGGLIEIGSVTSTAHAASDGTTGTGSATTTVSGVTVLGQPTTIGANGIVIPKFPGVLGAVTNPIVQNAISQVINAFGVTVTEFPATQSAKGAGYTATSGGVSIQIDPPSSVAPTLEQATSVLAPLFPAQAAIIPTLPGILQGLKVTVTLGRATASANAAAGFTNPPFTVPTTVSNGALPAVPGTASGSSFSGGSGSSVTPGGVSTGGSSVPGATSTGVSGSGTSSPSGAPVASPPAKLAGDDSPLGAGPIALGIVATLLFGYGLWMVARMLLPQDAEPVCPLGLDRS